MKLTKWILKRKVLMLALLAMIFTANAQNAAYISKHQTITTELSEQYGIPASVILAVAIVESSSGTGHAATRLNNHFGMVGKNNLKAQKKGYRSKYKQYDSDKDSFMDFCRVISNKNFYARLKDNKDCNEWVKAISHAGYSELPLIWEKRILNTISSNKL
jgi:Bax protein